MLHTYMVDVYGSPVAEERTSLYIESAVKMGKHVPFFVIRDKDVFITFDSQENLPSDIVFHYANLYDVPEENVKLRIIKRY